MSQDKIENRDKELIRRFRAVASYKAHHRDKNRRLLIGALIVLGCAAVFSLAAYTGHQMGSKTTEKAFKMAERVEIKTPATPETEKTEPVTAQKSSKTAPSSSPQNQEKSPPAAPSAAEPATSDTTSTGSEAPKPSIDAEAATEPDKTASAAPPEPAAPQPRIASLIACRDVENRRPVEPSDTFQMTKDSQPDVWVWMNVQSEKAMLPCTLRHVYYVNGDHYADVSLPIRYPRMRTWSNVTLTTANHIGQWRVDVVNADGQVLAQTRFTVAP